MLTIAPTAIEDVKVITPETFSDARGTFSETYNRRLFYANGIEVDFVQDNQSYSRNPGTIRGLHFQSPPAAQDKLVRVLCGSIFDVAVDLRRSSATYGKWVGETLSAENRRQLFVPRGFAHGFCTLQPETYVLYKVTAFYSPSHDLGIAWNDPEVAIDWPLGGMSLLLSDKDIRLPAFRTLPAYFE